MGFQLALVFVAIGDLFLRFGDELLSLALASVSLSIGADVLNVSQWLVFFVALAVLAPGLYPPPLRDLAETIPLRATIAVAGTATAAILTELDTLGNVGEVVLIALVFLVAVTIVLQYYEIQYFSEESPLVAGLDWFALDTDVAQQELETAKSYDGWKRSLALGIFALAIHVLFYAPVLIGAIVVMMLAESFPLPDVLVLVYYLLRLISSHVDWVARPPESLSIDEHLLTFVQHSSNSIHGLFVGLLFAIGLLMTVLPPLLFVRNVAELLVMVLRPPILPLLAWNVVGLCVLLLSALGYGLWFWFQMMPRIAAFFEHWNDAPREASLEPRPKSLLVPYFVTTAIATAGLSNEFLGANRYLFAVVWPLAVLGIWWVVWRTRNRHPTTARYADLSVTAAVLIAILTLQGNLAILQGDLGALLSPETGLLCGIVLYVAGLGRVSRYGDTHDRRYGDSDADDERRYALPVYLAIGGLYALLTTGYVEGAVRILLVVAGLVLVVSSVALGITKKEYL